MIPDGHEFALLLTHDVDRPHESFQSLYYAVADRDPSQLRTALSEEDPYWQFDDILSLEDDLGVRSSFYFLREKGMFERPLSDWTTPRYWIEALGRYDPESPEIVDLMRSLERGGWEVGLHGSYDSYADPDRLRYEKESLEAILGHEVLGGRQHYLNLDEPDTWRYQADAGLKYDASLGSSSTCGFAYGYDPVRPFDDEFVVFPTTIMEVALPDVPQVEPAWRECERLLEEAAENDAIMTVLWHPRYFNEDAFPGYRELYLRLIERAQDLDAWIGPAGEFYEWMDHPDGSEVGDEARVRP
jgi:hypothetical protein